MHFIGELREGERINEIYLCKQKQTALTKAGKPYESLVLQDKTGTLDAKIWDPSSQGIEECDALDYVNVMGDVTCFQGTLQLNVKRLRKASEGEYEPKDYLPVSEYDVEEMYRELQSYVKSLTNPYLKKTGRGTVSGGCGFCKTFSVSFRGKECAPRICGRTFGAYIKRDKALRFFCRALPDLKPGSSCDGCAVSRYWKAGGAVCISGK